MRPVHATFDRLEKMLPVYVSIMHSVQISSLVVTWIIISLNIPIIILKKRSEDIADPLARLQWILVLFVSVSIALFVGKQTQSFVYKMDCLGVNRQHYANLIWLKEYSQILRA